jgi:hypothetical protein
MSEKMIKVIEWTCNTDDSVTAYRLDDPEEGKRFFTDLNESATEDDSFDINEMSESDWDDMDTEDMNQESEDDGN